MKRKLTPLIACPELHHINKTMIIEIPLEFREYGRTIFRIVSSLNDLEKPRVKFKSNDLLKTILERGTVGKKLSTICVDVNKGNSLKSTEFLCEKKNSEVPNETKMSYQKLAAGNTEFEPTMVLSAADDPKQTVAQVCCTSKNSSADFSHSCKGFETHKVGQKTFLSPVKEHHHPLFKNSQNTGSEWDQTIQQLPRSSHLVPHKQEILQQDAKMFGKSSSHNWNPFKGSEDFGSSQGVNTNINHGSSQKMINQNGLSSCINHGSDSSQVIPESDSVTNKRQGGFAVRTTQNRDFGSSQEIDYCKNCRSFQQKEYHNPKSLLQKNPALQMCDKRNYNSGFQLSKDNDSGSSSSEQRSGMPLDSLCQYSDFNDFHQGSSNIYRSVDSACQNGMKSFSQHCVSGVKTVQRNLEYGVSSRAGSENVLSSKSSSWSVQKGVGRSDVSHSSNKNKVIHQEGQKQRTFVQIRSSNNRQHQVANIYKSTNEFPEHCFLKDLNWSEIKQILFLDVRSYPNFFHMFEKIPPLGMHIWIFMPADYKLKYPNELVNHRLLNMKLLHITLGDVNIKFPDVVRDVNCKLPPSVRFIIVSNKQFSIMESIKSERTVNLVYPKFSEGMSDIYRYIFKVDA